jgi:hypothetical protein
MDGQTTHPLSPADLDEQSGLLSILIYSISHLFGDINHIFSTITDPRAPKKSQYSVTQFAFSAILMFLCGLGARRQIGFLLRGGRSGDQFSKIFGAHGCPHGDTINEAFAQMNPDEFQALVCWMVFLLIRKKALQSYRLRERYYVVAIDGTWTINRKTRHCEHCLTQKKDGKTTYYHIALEAKIVTPNGFAIPVLTEFVENTVGQTKQDCELKAFYRLAKRLKEAFPRLPILLTMDGLFACGPVFQICEDYNWKYMVVLKDGSLPSVNEEFACLSGLQPENRLTRPGVNRKVANQKFRWVNGIVYTDTEKREHVLDVIECVDTRPNEEGTVEERTFRWVTNFRVTWRNVVELANDGGRIRWRIENEGFNVQKNGGYGLTHVYSTNANSAKIFHYLMQMAHLWKQLLVKGSLLLRRFPKGMGSVKNVGFMLLEAWRNARLPGGFLSWITQWRFQIRFCDGP